MGRRRNGALTKREELFCLEYLADLNSTAAAKRAGYSEKSAYNIGSENMKKPEIVARVRELQKDRCSRLMINDDAVLTEIMLEYKRCCDGEPVMEWNSDEHAYVPSDHVWQHDSRGALKALELLARHLGMLVDVVKDESTEPLHVIVTTVTDGGADNAGAAAADNR